MKKTEWVRCPVCGNKTRLQLTKGMIEKAVVGGLEAILKFRFALNLLWELLRSRGYFILDLCGFAGIEKTY